MSKTTIFTSIYTIIIYNIKTKTTSFLSNVSESCGMPNEEKDFSPDKIKYFKSFEEAYDFLHRSDIFHDKAFKDDSGHKYYITQIFID